MPIRFVTPRIATPRDSFFGRPSHIDRPPQDFSPSGRAVTYYTRYIVAFGIIVVVLLSIIMLYSFTRATR
jgi:hypothetical protein